MKEDKGLRMALSRRQEKHQMRLPNNFAHQTVQRIVREEQERSRRNHILMIVSLAAVTVFGIATMIYFCGAAIVESFKTIKTPQGDVSTIITISVCLLFFGSLNLWLKRIFK
jgi:hypothetical protein